MAILIIYKFHNVAILKKRFRLLAAMATNKNQQFGKIYMVGRGLLQKHVCKIFFKMFVVPYVINANFRFPLVNLVSLLKTSNCAILHIRNIKEKKKKKES